MLIEFDKDYLRELFEQGCTSDKRHRYQPETSMETAKKIYRPEELQPSEPIHPGEMLKDELEARGISQRKFAGLIGMPYTAFNEIINGKRPITTDTALKIEAATGIAATIWRGLQFDYDMQTARNDSKLSAILDNIRKSVAIL